MEQSSVVCLHHIGIPTYAHDLGKYFEVRYFLNVIVGSAHTSVIYSLLTHETDFVQEVGDCSIANRPDPHGPFLYQCCSLLVDFS
jgi:hypothetical protein